MGAERESLARSDADDADDRDVSEDGAADSFLRRVARISEVALPPPVNGLEPTLGVEGPAPPAMPALSELPQVLPQAYELRGEFARGGMGRILLAHDRRLGRTVALKELLSDSPDAAARFVHEAVITARLQHPCIVPVHEAGRWPGGKPFYAMKLVSGRPLGALLREGPDLSQRLTLLPVLQAVTEAVAYAHSQGVIHRDIKAANVVVGDFGETVVLDWGLAKSLVEERALQQGTLPGMVVGTPGFMPPEQTRGEPVDERADVYSLGALIYHVLAGSPPYRGSTSGQLMRQVTEGPPEPLQQRQPGVPADLLAIVDKAMARDPAARYPSAQELAADLRRFLAGQLVAAHHYSTLTLLRRWLRRHRALVAVSVAALLLTLSVAVYSVYRVVQARDRAEREQRRAVAAQAAAETARVHEATMLQDLVLAEARNKQDSDPTAALAWLKQLRPGVPQWIGARAVATVASGKGVALRLWSMPPLHDLAFSPDSRALVGTAEDRTLRLWSLSAESPPRTWTVLGEARHLALLADGAEMAVAGTGPVQIVDRTTGARRELPAGTGPIQELALSPDGLLLATAGADGTVGLFPVHGAGAVRWLRCQGPVSSVVFSADGGTLAARDPLGVWVWELPAGRAHRFSRRGGDQHGGRRLMAVSADGQLVVAGGPGGTVLWQVATGRERWLPEEGTVNLLALSPDGTQLASANLDGHVRLWDLRREHGTVLVHQRAPARDLAFSADGRWLAVTRGPLVRLWSLPGGELRKLRGHPEEVGRLAFSPNNAWLATASQDGTVRLWRLRGEAPEPVPGEPAALPAWLERATSVTLDSSYHMR